MNLAAYEHELAEGTACVQFLTVSAVACCHHPSLRQAERAIPESFQPALLNSQSFPATFRAQQFSRRVPAELNIW